ncbi:MAG TPA: beta-ketoacyl-ACP synthase III [Nevskiaceae bacterium]
MSHSRIAGTGSALPARRVTNAELAEDLATSDEWVVSRTGIRTRHIAGEGESTCSLATSAARAALASADVGAKEIGMIVLATTTPDMLFPSTASLVQAQLGIRDAAVFDVQAVCAGFVYALAVADRFVAAGMCHHALVIGADVFSRLIDWRDRRTAVLFGDGAGAVVLSAADGPGLMSAHLHSDARQTSILKVDGRVERGRVQGRPFVEMKGGEVFRFAVRALADNAREALRHNRMSVEELDWYIPHQANVRIIDAVGARLGLGGARVVKTVADHGNTSAASVPLALDVAARDGRLRPGQSVLLQGVGSGMTWGAVLLRW